MEIKEFQLKSTRTLNMELSKEQLISNMIFGANGELGEVTDILKKHLFHYHKLDQGHLAEEIGDVMFYLVNLATLFNFNMEDILQANVDKLKKRYPDGFTAKASVERVDINARA